MNIFNIIVNQVLFFRHLINHGVLLVLFFLFTTPFTSAQQQNAQFSSASRFNPSLAILMVIILSAFFLMGFFSVYIRQCAERRFSSRNFNTNASPIAGGGRRSRRRQLGLDKEVIDTFPTFLYSSVKGHKYGKESLECAVCLNEFEDDQTLRLIPKCNHVFHPECIDEWLASHTTCPVCRANLVPRAGDLAFNWVGFSELANNNNNSVEPDQLQPTSIIDDNTQNDVQLHVIEDNNDRNREMLNQDSLDAILLNTANQNRPPRSWSSGWRFGRLFPKSYSTGHSLVQPGDNVDRFTLKLPEEVRSQLLNTHLNRAKSCVAFPRVSSTKKGYRSRSLGTWHGKNYFYYERFNREGRSDHSGLTLTPPFFPRAGSVRLSKGVGSSGEVNTTTPKNFFKSVKSPFDQLFLGVDKANGKNDVVDEKMSDQLRTNVSDSQV